MKTVSFQTLLWRAALDVGRQPDPAAGEVMFSDLEAARLCNRLNAAADALWKYWGRWSLPETLADKTVTLTAGGIIPAAEIVESDWANAWSADPRAVSGAVRYDCQRLGDGSVRVCGAAEGMEVFVFYRTDPPRWTTRKLVESIYDSTALVWYAAALPAPVDVPDGHVYEALVVGSDWSDIADSNVWKRVTLPEAYADAVVAGAVATWFRRDAQMPDNAEALDEEWEQEMDRLALAAESNPGKKPWLVSAL